MLHRLTCIALVGVKVVEGNGKDMQNHSSKLIGAEAGSIKFQVETTFPGLLVNWAGDVAPNRRRSNLALELR
jgi:hypothetical protein